MSRSVRVTLTVDTGPIMRAMDEWRDAVEKAFARYRITVKPDDHLLAVEAWESEGGAL